MTDEKRIEILQAAVDRAFEAIADTPSQGMTDPGFAALLQATEHMLWQIRALSESPQSGVPEATVPDAEPAKPEKPEPEKPVETAKPAGEQKYTREDVRGALSRAHREGVNVADLMQQFGAKLFSEVRPEDYPAIMAKLEGN